MERTFKIKPGTSPERIVNVLGENNDKAKFVVRLMLLDTENIDSLMALEELGIIGDKLEKLYKTCDENYSIFLETIPEIDQAFGLFTKEQVKKNLDSETKPVAFIDQTIYAKYKKLYNNKNVDFTVLNTYETEILESFEKRFNEANPNYDSTSQPGEE